MDWNETPKIIGDLGYTSGACSDLMKLIREISETGSLEDFLRFGTELDLAIDNRDCLSQKERDAVSECMRKDNYFEDLGTGKYLDEMKAFADYVNDTIENAEYCDEELFRNLFLEGLDEMERYIQESVEQESFDVDERESIMKEYEYLIANNPFGKNLNGKKNRPKNI